MNFLQIFFSVQWSLEKSFRYHIFDICVDFNISVQLHWDKSFGKCEYEREFVLNMTIWFTYFPWNNIRKSRDVANGAYGFSWYSISPLQVQKDFILIALISQKGVKIKAKIYEVTLDTFGQVFLNVVIRIFQGLVFFFITVYE